MILGVEPNPYEATLSGQSPTIARRAPSWGLICCGGIALAVVGLAIMPGMMFPHPLAVAVLLGSLACVVIGTVAFIVGAIGCLFDCLRSDGIGRKVFWVLLFLIVTYLVWELFVAIE